MDVFDQIVEKIIAQQEAIIGPVAIERAKSVNGLKIDWQKHDVDITGDPKTTVDKLVTEYKELFGQIAVETCKEAVDKILSQLTSDQIPTSLR